MKCVSQQLMILTAGGVADMVRPLPRSFPPGPTHDIALEMARDPLLCFQSLKNSYGSTVGFKLATRPAVLVTSPKLVKEVLVGQSKTFVKAGTAFFPGSSLTGNGLLVSDGQVWLRQRRLANPAFRKSVVDCYAQVMVDLTSKFLERTWHHRRCTRDVYADFNRLTLEIVATTLFGGYKGSHTFDEIGQAITTAFKMFEKRGTSIFSVPEWFPTPDNLEYKSAIKKLDNVVYAVIKERRALLLAQESEGLERSSMESGSGLFQDLLMHLLQGKDDDSCLGMSDVLLRDELMTLLVAGQETSAILLAWCMHMLALHPHLQEKVYMEVKDVTGNKEPSHADIRQLRLTEAFVLETMRLMPPAYIVGRCADHSTTLGRWEIPKGTTVLVGIYLLHRDPLYWSEPLRFDPSRWLKVERASRLTEMDTYWPFGGGPRTCIGMGFAMMEACLLLSTILLRYKVSLPQHGSSRIKPKARITLRPEDKVELELMMRL
ncbi:hypothetical protein GOP47_0016232 [Adiantum capillus-veneris]|uniref:Cytochrome P450 n=1 Tax=Adiantum capillus-veneris TaxID=13818 RepID=A0A9D4UHQ4_ADICA|nr:hypothetical protein GOP47_0016232 [Adiantum capillus-veneris]